jgi:uncharacterized protein YkwD
MHLGMSNGAALLTRSRPLRAVAAIVVGAVLLSGCLSANAQSFVDRTNQLRASRGVPAVMNHGELDKKAQAWAEHLAATGTFKHSYLPDGLEHTSWQALGENLARGSSSGDWTLRLHNALVASPSHYDNLVNRRWTHMGVGVAFNGGTVYVVEVFADF